MTMQPQDLEQWVLSIAAYIQRGETPPVDYYLSFAQEPDIASRLIGLIEGLDDNVIDGDDVYYSACIFAIDIFVSQLQMALEAGNKQSEAMLSVFMGCLASAIHAKKHTIAFWMPVLNVFYEMHVELSAELKYAYLQLADNEVVEPGGDETSASAIQHLINELSHLSIFDITEHLFAQSYAMPADFFIDLVTDLFSVDKGRDIGVLALLHPNSEVREVVMDELDDILETVTLTSEGLSRLQAISHWYAPYHHDKFNRWIKSQRKKGVVFCRATEPMHVSLQASEVDGGGAQGLFICLKDKKEYRIGSLLCKQGFGIKDTWITPPVSKENMGQYFEEAFDENITLRTVDVDYLVLIVNHFLAVMLAEGRMPTLHLLEIQEQLGLQFIPRFLDTKACIQALSVQISPFTPEAIQDSFKRSAKWPTTKGFTESWYFENAAIDTLVNKHCSLVDGVKICDFPAARACVLEQELERYRDWWLFHFLWLALWAKVKSRKNEKVWLDAFYIAHAIDMGMPLKDIPLMQKVCEQTVLNSMETMQDRRTYLS